MTFEEFYAIKPEDFTMTLSEISAESSRVFKDTFARVVEGYRKHWFRWFFDGQWQSLAMMDANGQARNNAMFCRAMLMNKWKLHHHLKIR